MTRTTYLMRTRWVLSNWDMSEMITLSPTERPLFTSIVFTEARPSPTVHAHGFALVRNDLEDADELSA